MSAFDCQARKIEVGDRVLLSDAAIRKLGQEPKKDGRLPEHLMGEVMEADKRSVVVRWGPMDVEEHDSMDLEVQR